MDVLEHGILRWLVQHGFKVAVHVYIKGEVVKATVAAKDPKSGRLLQGWGPEALSALRDLACRSGVKALADLGQRVEPPSTRASCYQRLDGFGPFFCTAAVLLTAAPVL